MYCSCSRDDDKFGRRDRFNGPTSDFKEKDGFKPNVKLEYIDDDGHVLSAKEAFRYLSHKFHGKGPGKNKVLILDSSGWNIVHENSLYHNISRLNRFWKL